MRLTLVVPNLAALPPAALAGVTSLARLSRYAGPAKLDRAGIEGALLAASGVPDGASVAALAASGVGLPATTGYAAFADPVTLVAGRDDVLLAGRVDDLSEVETQALLATLNAHFAADEIAFYAPHAAEWLVTSRAVPTPASTPLAAVHGAIEPHLPHGQGAKEWRRWSSEMQMLLHEHPVNARRAEHGLMEVTGLWIWGGGALGEQHGHGAATIYASEERLGDIARGIADGKAQRVPENFAALGHAHDAIVVLPAALDASSLTPLANAWLDPAVRALERRVLHELVLIGDGAGEAFAWTARAPSLTTKLRARFAPRTFALPSQPPASGA